MSRERHEDDLNFLRELVSAPGGGGRSVGRILALAGVLYGLQCLIEWAQAQGWLPMPGALSLAIGLGPTAIFLLGVVLIIVPTGNLMPQGGAAARAINGSFAAAGLANMALLTIFAINATREGDFRIWEFYPPVVFALQGAAWMVAYSVNRRGWHLIVAIGWLCSAIALGVLIGSSLYGLGAALALLVWMAIPGVILMRQAGRRADK